VAAINPDAETSLRHINADAMCEHAMRDAIKDIPGSVEHISLPYCSCTI
jgi:hypothetical protein